MDRRSEGALFAPRLFITELIQELARRHHPVFGERNWSKCLEVAVRADDARRVAALNSALDYEQGSFTIEESQWSSIATAVQHGVHLDREPKAPNYFGGYGTIQPACSRWLRERGLLRQACQTPGRQGA